MKAIAFTKYGSPDFLKLTEIEKPAPKDNEVLVKVYAASINSWDWELLRAKPFVNRLMFGLLKPKRLKTLGADISGEVEAVGKNVTYYQEGDKVFGDLSGCGWGGFAEYVCAREDAFATKPSNLTFEEAAAVPQAGLLALQGLRYYREVQPGQKVLINGASGGAGSFAVQMAKVFGAVVTGVCSTGKMDLVRSLRCDHVIDYTQEDFTKNGELYDLIVDINGYHSIFDYRRALRPGGAYAMVGGSSSLVWQLWLLGPLISMTSNKKMGLMLHKPNKDLAFMKELLESGKVVPVIDRHYPLSDVPEAMRYFGEGRARGKIIITMET